MRALCATSFGPSLAAVVALWLIAGGTRRSCCMGASDAASTTSSSEEGIEAKKAVNASAPLKIAFCLNGQLARLEMYSKVTNIFVPNARMGHLVHVFVYLDNEVNNVKQTYWNYDYSESLYGSSSRKQIKAVVDDAVADAGVKARVRTRVLLQAPPRHAFPAAHDGPVPVKDKPFTGHDGPHDLFESAASRFENNMRWMAGLRECAKWVMATELDQKWFYDVVVRLREDTFAFGPWLLSPPELYRGGLSSMSMGNFGGVNDHNFVVDRLWLDDLYRGLTEDYYFNSSLEHEPWGNPEHHIYQVATAYQIPLLNVGVCEQPLIPLRGLVNKTHWHVHPFYVRQLKEACWPKVIKEEQDDDDDDNDDKDDDDDDDKKKKDKAADDKAASDDKKKAGGGHLRRRLHSLSLSLSLSPGVALADAWAFVVDAVRGWARTSDRRRTASKDADAKSKGSDAKDTKDGKEGKDKRLTVQPTFAPRVVPSCCPPLWQDIVHYKAVRTTAFKDINGAGADAI